MEKILIRSSCQRFGNSKNEKSTGGMDAAMVRPRHGTPAMHIAMVLLCLTMISFYLMSGLYARYTSEDADHDQARVAAYVFDAGGDVKLALNELQTGYPGANDQVEFTVTNASGSTVCEVNQKLLFTLKFEGDIPLKVTLSDMTSGTDVLVVDSTNYSANIDGPFTGTATTNDSNSILLPASVASSRTLRLIAEWPADRNASTYESGNRTSHIELDIISVQVD